VAPEFGGVPDLDPSVGSLAARHAAERVEEADQEYDDAYCRAFESYYAQAERTWDIDGSFPVEAGDIDLSPDAASWSPPPAPGTRTQPPEMTGARAGASNAGPVPHQAPEAAQVQPPAAMAAYQAGLGARVAALGFPYPLRPAAPEMGGAAARRPGGPGQGQQVSPRTPGRSQ